MESLVKIRSIMFFALVFIGLTSLTHAQTTFEATLSGSNEVPSITSPASGTITATLTGNDLVIEGEFEGLVGDFAASHIHLGMAGEAGGVLFPLTVVTNVDNKGGTILGASNTFTLSSGQIDTLNARGFYVNVHSSEHGGGELRGQLQPNADAYFRANLSGAFEPTVAKTRGSGSVVLELIGDSLFVSGSFNGLSGTYAASHIHLAPAGSGGGVSFALSPTIGVDNMSGIYFATNNKFELTAQQKQDLWDRDFYVNVHSSAYGGGELRGQITPPVTALFYATLSGSAEKPSVESSGTGTVIVEVSGTRAIVSGGFKSLPGDFAGSHLHAGKVDASGGVEIALSPATITTSGITEGEFEIADNTYALSATQLDSLFNESLYVNVHSSTNAGGEVRGQLLFGAANQYTEPVSILSPVDEATVMLSTTLSTAFQVNWGHDGMDPDGNQVAYIWQLSATSNFSDILINTNVGSDLMFETTHGDVNTLLANLGVSSGGSATVYHRVIATDGRDETYGDTYAVTLQRPVYGEEVFEIQLSGSNEVPPITSPANGKVMAFFNGTHLVLDGKFGGLTGEYSASHLHFGEAGKAGPVELAVSPNIDPDMKGGTFVDSDTAYALTPEQIAKLHSSALYLNIHSSTQPGGELRGQVLPKSDAYFRANLSGAFEVPASKSMGFGGAMLELRGDTLYVGGSFSALSETYAASHLHIGKAGSNGGVAFALSPVVNVDQLGGVFVPDQNKFGLDAGQKTALWNREFYINVHTSRFPGGELRGQVTPPVTASFYASLSGSAENESVEVSGTGAVLIELHRDTLIATGSFKGLESNFAASHIHTAHAGANGGVLTGLNAIISNDTSGVYNYSDNKFALTMEQQMRLFDRDMYINVHTSENGGGELRGQILGDATAYFKTKLSGDHENDPVFDTNGFGAANIEFAGNRIIVSGGFDELSAAFTGAHIHTGAVDNNGGVAVALNPTISNDTTGVFEPKMNTFTVTPEQATAMFAEGTYVNVHSSANPGGELRGQALFGDNFFPSQVEITAPTNGSDLTVSGNTTTTLMVEWTPATDANGNALRYLLGVATDAGFENIIYTANVGAATSAELSFGVLDGLLADLNVGLNASTTLYHSVMVTDGSNESFSDPKSVNLTRGMVTSNEDELGTEPLKFGLDQNYPNPFNPSTNITFTLSESGNASLKVYNMLGQEVATLANERMNSGLHSYNFDASQLASGMYIYQLKAQNQTVTKRMMLIK